MVGGSHESRRVLLDVNIYVRSAAFLGPGKGWQDLPPPPPPILEDAESAAAQVLRVVCQGILAGDVRIVPCLGSHIVSTTLRKLTDPVATDGLDWYATDAEYYFRSIHTRLMNLTAEDPDVTTPVNHPTVEREDQFVLACARACGAHTIVTGDMPFLVALNDYPIDAVSPKIFLERVERFRGLASP